MSKYVIGCDFGTLSMRAVLVDCADGSILAEETFAYPHGVITGALPSGARLDGPDWALQHPGDYIGALERCVPAVVKTAGVDARDVCGIGVDFTVCTMIPLDENIEPLCKQPEFRNRPHAWIKLWKNHTAHREADDITRIDAEQGFGILEGYGYKASSEFFFPKVWEVLRKDEEVYRAAYTFAEAGDWVTSKLCGKLVRGGVLAAAKGFHNNEEMRFPSKEFFAALDKRLENIVEEKHLTGCVRVGTPAGKLTGEMAEKLGLSTETVVCSAHADAAVAPPGGGVVRPNVMMFVMGTSLCHMMMAESMEKIPGMCAAYYEGILPGLYVYEAGQNAVGDIFDWFWKNYLPPAFCDEAAARGMHALELLGEKASALGVGESGLIALDWHNGNRSILQDANLTGLLVGLTLATKPEEIYRALVEATAFGTKVIMDQFAKYNVPVKELYACGGLAHKNEFMMQVFSDVLGLPIKVTASPQTSALSTAIFAAVAAGQYPDHAAAVAAMVPPPKREYSPNLANTTKYAELFEVYLELHDYFGRSENSPMKRLRAIQNRALERS